jgi:hypothetical protein
MPTNDGKKEISLSYGSLVDLTVLEIKEKNKNYDILNEKGFYQAQYQQYKVNTSVTPQTDFTDPISIYIKEFEEMYEGRHGSRD